MQKVYQFLVAVPLAIAATTLTCVSPSFAELPPLIPRLVLFGNPEKTNPQISPNGKYLTYLAPDNNNVLQIWIRSVGQQDDRILTAQKKRGIRNYFWTYDGQQLIYRQDADGDENWHFYAVNTKSNQQPTRTGKVVLGTNEADFLSIPRRIDYTWLPDNTCRYSDKELTDCITRTWRTLGAGYLGL